MKTNTTVRKQMAWSMCVVAARADRRMEEIRHTHTDTDISRPADTGHVD